MSAPRILIVGGSTRAAADSVRRAGGFPICADLFADLDLRKTADVIPIRQYPDSLPEDVAHVQADGWFYCGALENHPDIIAKLLSPCAPYGPLLGTPPDALKLVRDPAWLVRTLHAANIPALAIAREASPPKPDGYWLQKPIASAGGRLIRIWNESASRIPLAEPHYFQKRAFGVGLSALFRVQNGNVEWLGASRELEARSSSQAPTSYSYCGSIGPLNQISILRKHQVLTKDPFRSADRADESFEISDYDSHRTANAIGSAEYLDSIQPKLTRIAIALVKNATGLRGLIGLDFRFDGDDVWLTEVNPRYTASVEVLEFATGRSLLHLSDKCNAANIPQVENPRPFVVAKQILYANVAMEIPDLSDFVTSGNPWQVPLIADIPVPHIVIEPGWPICTVMAAGENAEVIESTLAERVSQVQATIARM